MQGGFWAYIQVVDPSQIGGIGGPRPDQGLPGPQPPFPGQGPRPDHGLPAFPSHPIAQPPGGWGGRPPGQGGIPSHPIYNPPYPDQGLPPFPSQGLPGHQPRPDHDLPPFPSQGLPGGPFPPGAGPNPQPPGGPAHQPSHGRWVWSPVYGWVYVPGQITGGGGDGPHPDHSLPGPQPHPDQGLPANQPHPDQELPRPQPRPDNTLPQNPSPKGSPQNVTSRIPPRK